MIKFDTHAGVGYTVIYYGIDAPHHIETTEMSAQQVIHPAFAV